MPNGVRAADIRRHFQKSLGFQTINRLPFISNDSTRRDQFAFVYMDAQEVVKALAMKSTIIRGVKVAINPDRTIRTQKRQAEAEAAGISQSYRDSTSVVGKLWKAVQEWQNTHLLGLGDGPPISGSRVIDLDFTTQCLQNQAFDAEVQRRFKSVSRQWAEQGSDDKATDRIMATLRQERAKYQGAERDQWAASWWRRSELEHKQKSANQFDSANMPICP